MPGDEQFELRLPAPAATGDTPLIPARMVNEFVYCPRLAYLMWTQAEWSETGDTVEGRRVHTRVDRPSAPLPAPETLEASETKLSAGRSHCPLRHSALSPSSTWPRPRTAWSRRSTISAAGGHMWG